MYTDLHLDFLARSSDVFELGLRDAYKRLHKGAASSSSSSAAEEEDLIEATVNG